MTLDILAGMQMLSSIIIPDWSGWRGKGQGSSDQFGRWQQHFLVTKGQSIWWPESSVGVTRAKEGEGEE